MPAESMDGAANRFSSDIKAQTRIYARLDSTNLEAKRLIDSGERGPFWLLAHEQTAGQGRRLRVWHTGSGNLAASWMGFVAAPPVKRAQMGFALALAAHDALQPWCRSSCLRLKWPNDIQILDAKMGGILLESGSHPSGDSWLIAGIGINLLTAPLLPDRPTICLRDALRDNCAPPSAETLLTQIQTHFDLWRCCLQDEGFAPIRSAWLACAYGLHAPVRVEIGARTLIGRFQGLDENGAMLLERDNGEVISVSAGDVFFDREAKI